MEAAINFMAELGNALRASSESGVTHSMPNVVRALRSEEKEKYARAILGAWPAPDGHRFVVAYRAKDDVVMARLVQGEGENLFQFL